MTEDSMKTHKRQSTSAKSLKRSRKRFLDGKRKLVYLLVSFGLAVGVLSLIALPFFTIRCVDDYSVSVTTEKKQLIIINKRAPLKHFDEIYLKSPIDDHYAVRRLIGLPGDTVSLQSDQLIINGVGKTERYLNVQKQQLKDKALTGNFTLEQLTQSSTVPIDSYFVLADNRKEDLDSRHYGFVKKTAIVGKVEN